MNENKDIKKLSENGEQSAEQVAGGAGINPEVDLAGIRRLMSNPDEPMYGCCVMGYCHDCGERTTNNAYGNYCRGCWLRRKHTGRPPTDEELMELRRKRLERMELQHKRLEAYENSILGDLLQKKR